MIWRCGGSNFILYDESFDEIDEHMDRIKAGMKQVGENSNRASDSAKGLDNFKPPENLKASLGDVKRQMDEVKSAFKNIKIK